MSTITTATKARRLIGHDRCNGGPNLGDHLRLHGALPIPDQRSPAWSLQLLGEIESSGLTGRGGAGFSTFAKLVRAQSAGGHPTVVANGMEGEPASYKDQFLMAQSPHLVLDGAELVACALDAARVVLCLPDDRQGVAQILESSIVERQDRGYSNTQVELLRLPARYIAGEESALVSALAGRVGLPTFRTDKSIPLRVDGRSVVVNNVETLANIALIVRYGGQWFRSLGTAESPGSCLVTISGAVERPGVVEVEIGAPLEQILALAQPLPSNQAVLVGGYGGTWVPAEELGTAYAPAELKAVGAAMGAGVLVALSAQSCGLRQTERIVRFMAEESAGQCGPCLFGLAAIADDLDAIAGGTARQDSLDRLQRRCGMVAGRGACRHPDGVVRLVRSALDVFSEDLACHLGGRPCVAEHQLEGIAPAQRAVPSQPGGSR